ncbi:MAG: tRNA glutamyl-Q(34) synthetase GluQRS [Janthinobacterium lividum]
MHTTRFAPSPTGALHLGHVHAALFAHRLAAPGRFLLRIEDIDPARCRAEHEAGIAADLRWLGLDWQHPVRRQSEHLDAYRAVLDALDARGLLFPCFCTRAEIAAAAASPADSALHAPHTAEPAYPGTCRRLDPGLRRERLARGDPHALRLDMAAALRTLGRPLGRHERGEGRLGCHPARFGDVVLGRRDVPASYHLCATHDDALQGVTLVTRGADLRPAADLHRLLQALMGWPEPEYAHHGLLHDAAGRRLSKRAGAPTVASLRAAGATPEAVRAWAEEARPEALPLDSAKGSPLESLT